MIGAIGEGGSLRLDPLEASVADGLRAPALGDRPIAEIPVPELLEVLRKVEARGRYETANRLRSTFGTIFRYAIATSRAQRDVAYDLRGALITPKVSHRSAITAPKEVGALLRAIGGHEGQPTVRTAFGSCRTSS